MTSTEHARILFQGDSITDGGRGRNEDANHWLGQSYVYLIAGALGSRLTTTQPEFVNRGISGIEFRICMHAGMRTCLA